MRRIFLNWDRPFLRTAARWSIERVRSGRQVDLSAEEHVLSGRRATRRYLELLLEECERERLLLDPPELLVPRSYCARHARAELRMASDLELEFAWRATLAGADPQTATALSISERDHNWLAAQLAGLHREVRAHGADLDALQADPETPPEALDRLAAIAALLRAAESRLHGADLTLLESSPLAASDSELLLIGVLELPASLEAQLHSGREATALVHAAEEDADRFDSFGRPRPEAWTELSCALDLRVAENPAQLAAQMIVRLAELAETPRDQIALGLLDPQVEAPLHNELQAEGLNLHRAEGIAPERQALWQSLTGLAELLRDGSYRALARTLRTPLVDARLREQAGGDEQLIEAMDRFASDHLLYRLGQPWPPPQAPRELRGMLQWIDELCEELRGAARPLRAWANPIRNCVQRLHGDEQLDFAHPAGRRALAMLDALRDLLESLENWPQQLDLAIEGHAALDLLLQGLRRVHLSEIPDPDALESLGWLELANDDAEHVLLLGANEGFLPATTAPDPFLTDALRARLGLPHDESHEARDLYLLERLLRGRSSCTVFVSRRDLSAAPLLPSRLLLRCAEHELGPRLKTLLESGAEAASWPQRLDSAELDAPSIHRPPQLPRQPVERLSVTDFRSWQSCPYRHQLRRVLGVRARDFEPRELDSLQFGSLVHDLLESFAREAGDLRRASEIEAWLLEALQSHARENFASWAHPSTRLQAELIAGRLRAFAQAQERRFDEGWRILEVERTLSMRVAIDEIEVEIHGRIDRIDRHRDGRIAILDYKTSREPADPTKEHGPRRDGAWTDFQLPLYRKLYAATHPDCNPEQIELGYFQLPEESLRSGIAIARWDDAQLDSCWDRVEEIVRAMRRGEGLDAPVDPAPKYSEDLSLICRDAVLAEEEE